MESSRETLVVIPARGGSKGIPDKNIRPLDGRPLIEYTIRSALDAGIGRVVVSTDDARIAEVSRRAGAEVPFERPRELATDTAGSVGVVLHALDELSFDSGGEEDEYSVCLLQPTSPLRSPRDIVGCWKRHCESNRPVVSVELEEKPLAWVYRMNADDELEPRFPEKNVSRRQDADVFYMPNGAIYILDTELLREGQSLIPDGSLGWRMPPERSVDIDDAFDWILAEAVLNGQMAKVRRSFESPVNLGDMKD